MSKTVSRGGVADQRDGAVAAGRTDQARPHVQRRRAVAVVLVLVVADRELAAVIGPSGSGKSTLLHLMGTLDRPSSGVVRVTGLDMARMTDREVSALRASRIGFVFQQFFLAEHRKVLDNVADGLLLRRLTSAESPPGGGHHPPACRLMRPGA